jgi:hypothetical protein
VAVASVSLALLAIPVFGGAVGAAEGSGNATPAVINPSTPPLFTQCPAVHDNTGCGVLITLNANGKATIATDTNQGPFDNPAPQGDDTLVGVVNDTNVPIPNIILSSTNDIFAFDGDGICTFTFTGDSYCGKTGDSTGYGGPTSTYSAISSDDKSGTVNFTALAPGASTYFSLENSLTGADFTIPADFTVAKSVTSTGPYIAGDTSTPIDYQVAVHNFGGTPGNVAVSDVIPTGTTLAGTAVCPTGISPALCTVGFASNTITWDLFGVPAGATINLTFSVVPNASTSGYTVDNTANWRGPGCASDPIGPINVSAQSAPDAVTLTPCPTNTTTTDVTLPIPVTITASNTSTTVGTVPAPVCTITGDTLGAPASGPTSKTTVTATTGVGTYNGANTCSGAADPRYTFTYVPGNAVVTAAAVTAPATTPTSTTTTTAAPKTAASTTTALAFTGALLDQEWIVGIAAVLLGLGLLFMARWRRRTPKHAARR